MYGSSVPDTMNAASPTGTSSGIAGTVKAIAMNVHPNATINGPVRFSGRRAHAMRPVAANAPDTSSPRHN